MRARTRVWLVGSAIAVAAVVAVGARSGADPTATAPQPISDLSCLRKMSLDLAHRGPSPSEIADVEAKRVTLAQMADTYLASPEFAQVVFDWYRREFPPTSITPAGIDTEEPARIAQHIVIADHDLRELLTASYTVDTNGNEVPQSGKPAAGVLSTQHYMSSALGLLRRNWAGRFERQWTGIVLQAVSIPPGDPVDTSRDGVAANPVCAGCHVHPIYGIDPLAKFAECWKPDGTWDATCADPDAEFLTAKGRGLPALGAATVATNEWKSQMVSFFFRRLFGRPMAKSETGYYLEAEQALEDSGYKAKALLKHLVTTPAYCAR